MSVRTDEQTILLYNDYFFTLLGRNSLLPIENEKGLEKNYRQWYKRCQISIQNKDVLTIKSPQPGRRETRSERNLGLEWGSVARGIIMCGLRT